VICFFMHLIQSDRISWIMMAAALFMLFVMLYLTLIDYWSRSLVKPDQVHVALSQICLMRSGKISSMLPS
jgi:hypothetical protein